MLGRHAWPAMMGTASQVFASRCEEEVVSDTDRLVDLLQDELVQTDTRLRQVPELPPLILLLDVVDVPSPEVIISLLLLPPTDSPQQASRRPSLWRRKRRHAPKNKSRTPTAPNPPPNAAAESLGDPLWSSVGGGGGGGE
eukprot:734704-Prorocentrum_minimum.AAC.1